MSIPYGKHNITQEDIDAVIGTLKSDFLTQGPKVKELEQEFCNLTGSKYAVAVCNATVALHLASLACEIKKDDHIITTPMTFVATANGPRYCGAKIDFVDINPKTYNLDLDLLEQKLKSFGPNVVKAVYPVSFAGYPFDCLRLRKLAETYNFKIIEDACHAPGAYYKGSDQKKITSGGCEFSDLAVFSLHPVKHIAAGEGGIITTNSLRYYNKLLKLRTHGITNDPKQFKNPSDGPWYYEMQELGFNYRLSEIHASLAISQISRLKENIKRRQEIANIYDQEFSNLNLITPYRDSNISHAFHLYIIQTSNRGALYSKLRENKIYSQIHYIPVHKQPYYEELLGKQNFPIAEAYYEKCLSLPNFPELSDQEQQKVIRIVKEFSK